MEWKCIFFSLFTYIFIFFYFLFVFAPSSFCVYFFFLFFLLLLYNFHFFFLFLCFNWKMVDGVVVWGLSRRFLLEVVAFETSNGNGERKKAKQLEYERKYFVPGTNKTPPTFHSIDCEGNS